MFIVIIINTTEPWYIQILTVPNNRSVVAGEHWEKKAGDGEKQTEGTDLDNSRRMNGENLIGHLLNHAKFNIGPF